MGKRMENSAIERVTWDRFYITVNQARNQISPKHRRLLWRQRVLQQSWKIKRVILRGETNRAEPR